MNAVNSRRPFRKSTWNEYYTNERQSRDSNRNATNAGSTRTTFCVFRRRYDRQRMLVIRIAAITLASDSAITLARFRPSKHRIYILLEILRRGRSRGGRCANLSQIARQICAKLPLFLFVHHTKGAQNCRKFDSQFRTILCKYPFSNAPFMKFRSCERGRRSGALPPIASCSSGPGPG